MATPYYQYGAVGPQQSQGPPPTQPTYEGDVPPEDVDEKSAPGRAPSAPPAPNITDLGQIGGYESVNYTNSEWEVLNSYVATVGGNESSSCITLFAKWLASSWGTTWECNWKKPCIASQLLLVSILYDGISNWDSLAVVLNI